LQRLFSAAALESSALALHDVGSAITHFSSSFTSELLNQIHLARSFDWSSAKKSGEHIDKKFVLNIAVASTIQVFLKSAFGSYFDTIQVVELSLLVKKHLEDDGSIYEYQHIANPKAKK